MVVRFDDWETTRWPKGEGVSRQCEDTLRFQEAKTKIVFFEIVAEWKEGVFEDCTDLNIIWRVYP